MVKIPDSFIQDHLTDIKETYHVNQITNQTYVGGYRITGDSPDGFIQFNFVKKPNLINRLFCKWCLGWTWENF